MERPLKNYLTNFHHPYFKRTIYAAGILSIVSLLLKFVFRAKRFYETNVLIKPFLQKLRPPVEGQKEWMSLLFLDFVGKKELALIDDLAKYVNLIIVWQNVSTSNSVFDHLDSLNNFKHRIITYDPDDNFNKIEETITEEITDVSSDYLIVQHREYFGATPWDKSEPTLSLEQMTYFRKKINVFTMSVNGFLKAKREKDKIPMIFLDIKDKMTSSFDRFLSKTMEGFVVSLDANKTFKFQRIIR